MKMILWNRVINLSSPQQCFVCGGRLSPTENAMCSVCSLHLPRTGFCSSPHDNPMARLFWGLVAVDKAAALFYYTVRSNVARVIYAMKYYGRADIGLKLGRMAALEFMDEGFFDDVDVIVPVPLARKRQRERGYNQSEAIARGVSSVTGLPVECRAVERTVFHVSQTSLMRWERMDNVDGIFRLSDASRLRGRHVLLVDDVVTTGATLTACASVMAAVPGIRLSMMTLGYTK